MLHLFNNQVGFDAKTLGFPSVDSCNAIVYQTKQGLCGLHNYGGDSPFQFESRAAAFLSFVQQCNIAHTTQRLNLYSIINKRYSKETRTTWIEEMRAFAKALGFKGTVHLISLQKHRDGGSVYIQADLNSKGDACDISYKKWSKMQEKRIDASPSSLHELKKDMTAWNQSMGTNLRYNLANPTEVVGSVAFKNTSGTLHPATGDDKNNNSFRFTFDVN